MNCKDFDSLHGGIKKLAKEGKTGDKTMNVSSLKKIFSEKIDVDPSHISALRLEDDYFDRQFKIG